MTRSFLSLLFSSKKPEQCLLIWVKDKPQGGTSYWFHDLAEASKFALGQAKKYDVYFDIALANRKGTKSQRVKSEQAAAIPGLWAEVDYRSGNLDIHKKDEQLPPTPEDALQLVAEMPFRPTVILHSGHGFHVYWLFEELWQLETPEERELAQTVVEKWQRLLKEKALAHGWANDSTFDLARVYRVAGTKNWKIPEKPQKVVVQELNDSAVFKRAEMVAHIQSLKLTATRTKQRQEIKDRVGEMGALVLDPQADVSMSQFDMLKEIEPKFKLTWERKRRDFKDQSASSYDFSLANYAAQANWTDQEIANLLIAWRRKHGENLKLRQDYYLGTIAKARKERDKGNALESLSLTSTTPDEKLEIISTLIGLTILQIHRYLTEPPHYVLMLGGNRPPVQLVDGDMLFEQAKLRKVLRNYGRFNMPTFKPAVWQEIGDRMQECIVDVAVSDDATELGACKEWLRSYLRDYIHPERVDEGQRMSLLEGKPGLLEGDAYFAITNLRKYIAVEFGDAPTKVALIALLEQIGCKFHKSKSFRFEDGGHTSRSLWQVPHSFFVGDDLEIITVPMANTEETPF